MEAIGGSNPSVGTATSSTKDVNLFGGVFCYIDMDERDDIRANIALLDLSVGLDSKKLTELKALVYMGALDDEDFESLGRAFAKWSTEVVMGCVPEQRNS